MFTRAILVPIVRNVGARAPRQLGSAVNSFHPTVRQMIVVAVYFEQLPLQQAFNARSSYLARNTLATSALVFLCTMADLHRFVVSARHNSEQRELEHRQLKFRLIDRVRPIQKYRFTLG